MNTSRSSSFHGIMLIDKPSGCTSFEVVKKIKRLVKPIKVGHAGTLDPLASGLLPICIGEATKLVRFLSIERKRYRAVVTLGIATDTLDRLGTKTKLSEVPNLSDQFIQTCCRSFLGEIQQVPPMYSALHHQGKRLYELARQGLEIERKPRTVQIFEIALLARGNDWLELDITCSAGTYIRSLVADLAVKLGTLGHLAELQRTESSGWELSESNALEKILATDPTALPTCIIPIEHALTNLTRIDISQDMATRLAHGQKIYFGDINAFKSIGIKPHPFWLRPPSGSPLIIASMKPSEQTDQPPQIEILRILKP